MTGEEKLIWQQKKRFILRMWAKGYKGMPKQGWIKWNW
jgi:hypothetical protein